jgi:hypothetical protein
MASAAIEAWGGFSVPISSKEKCPVEKGDTGGDSRGTGARRG